MAMTPKEFRDWRFRQGFTQVQAAAALGLSKSTIELYEGGKRRDNQRPVVIPKVVELATQAITAGST